MSFPAFFSASTFSRYCSIVVTSRNWRTLRESLHSQLSSWYEKEVKIAASTTSNRPTLRAGNSDIPNLEMRSLLEIRRSFLLGEEYLSTQKRIARTKSIRSSSDPWQR